MPDPRELPANWKIRRIRRIESEEDPISTEATKCRLPRRPNPKVRKPLQKPPASPKPTARTSHDPEGTSDRPKPIDDLNTGRFYPRTQNDRSHPRSRNENKQPFRARPESQNPKAHLLSKPKRAGPSEHPRRGSLGPVAPNCPTNNLIRTSSPKGDSARAPVHNDTEQRPPSPQPTLRDRLPE
jgi:hypothetical protein